MAELKPPETAVVIVEGAEAPLAIETELGDAAIGKWGVGDAVKVSTELPEPGAAIEDGLKEAVTPAGRPEAERAMAALKPPETAVVIVEVLVLPCTTETELGAAAIVKSGVVTTLGVTEMQVEGAEAQASLPVGKAVTW